MTGATTAGASSVRLRTALFDCHSRHGAKFVTFAGYEMPIQYPLGVLREHLHTRASAGIFDVGHMGQIAIRHRTGDVTQAAHELEKLLPADIVGLGRGRQRYSMLLNMEGGIADDVMVANLGTHLLVIVNAATKRQDEAILRARLQETCSVKTLSDQALVALQGPLAETVLARHFPEVIAMRFMDVLSVKIGGYNGIISRSGYTGEDGFEISIANSAANEFVEKLLADSQTALVGLGARDSLRLEAGLCLYGNDLDNRTTPVSAALEWSIQKVRRAGGARSGGFPGADLVLRQLATGTPTRRVGLLPMGKAPVRGGALLFESELSDRPIGAVTSGGFGPTAERPVTMGYVESRFSELQTVIFAEVRGARLAVNVSQMPFVPHRYKRG
jgi:aminomethyltransferase